ncbi:NB-ARC domain-containing protein [Streptomyces sp. PmtG]
MRVRGLRMAALAGAAAVVAALASLAANAATSAERWPGPLDLLRRHAWWSVAALAAATVVLAAVSAWRQERPAAAAGDPPPPAPSPVPDWVVDRGEGGRAAAAVCATRRTAGRAVGITTSLEGAGGFGKTTLAAVVCASPKVRRHFRGRIFTVTIGRDVRGRAAVAAKVAEVTRFVTGDPTAYDDPDLAGAHLGRLLDERPRTLLVLDDVWESAQLAPFLQGGERCVRLVTTRVPALLPPGSARVRVDQMSPAQARSVLTWRLPPLPPTTVRDLLAATGRWALLLRLTNRLIAGRVATGADPAAAAGQALRALRTGGPAALDAPATALDLDDPSRRARAVRATVEAARLLLAPGGADRLAELGVFAEDEAVPVPLVAGLWQRTGGLDEAGSRDLCAQLDSLSLISLTAGNGGRLTLHDVLRDYLREELGPDRLTRLHGDLLDVSAPTRPCDGRRLPWWETTEGYLLDHLVAHLRGAGRNAEAESVAGDIHWIEARLRQRGPTGPTRDLAQIPTTAAADRGRDLGRVAHLLGPLHVGPVAAGHDADRLLANVLHSRLAPLLCWYPQIVARQLSPSARPLLANRWYPPDLPPPGLLRTLVGHEGVPNAVAVAPDGLWLATGDEQGEVRLWDIRSGHCTAVLTGHRAPVTALSFAPDGTWLASGGSDREVRLWEVLSGSCTTVLTGHTRGVAALAIAPDGTWLAAATGRVVRLWHVGTATSRVVLKGHRGPVRAVVIAPDGSWLATGGKDPGVRLWDAATGRCRTTLGQSGACWLGVTADGGRVATGSGGDRVGLWDPVSGACVARRGGGRDGGQGHAGAVAPDGTWAAAAADRTVRVWDLAEDRPRGHELKGHQQAVTGVAVAPDGSWLASTSLDRTIRLWETGAGPDDTVRSGRDEPVQALAR